VKDAIIAMVTDDSLTNALEDIANVLLKRRRNHTNQTLLSHNALCTPTRSKVK